MKKLLSLILITSILLSVFLMSSCSKNEAPSGMKIAYRSDAMYKLYVPSGWRVDYSSSTVSAYDSLSNPISVTVNTAKNEADQSIEEYFDSYLGLYNSTYNDFQVASKEKCTIDSASAYKYILNGTLVNGDDKSYKYTIVQVIALHNGYFFIITFSTLESSYEDNKESIDKIINNFLFNDSPSEKPEEVNTEKEAPEGYKCISNKVVDYDFFVPNSWTQDMNTGVISAYTDDKTSVNITCWDVSYMINVITDWRVSFLKDMSLISSDFTDDKTTETKLDSVSAIKYESHATIAGVEMKYIQVAAARNYMIYLVTYSATADKFDLHLQEFNNMVSYFKFN